MNFYTSKQIIFLLAGLPNMHKSNAESITYGYSISDTLPIGKPNHDAPKELQEYVELFGTFDQVNTDSTQWFVAFFSSKNTELLWINS